ncbi:MAG: hypothetical protein IJE12_07285 [Prevotella sp.]|nr:hypothetical protein [Prevotella sp.]
MAEQKCLVIQTPGVATDSDLKKLENYVGIEFLRGSSDGGGDNGYYRMIGDETLLKRLPIHNAIKNALVKSGVVTTNLNQVNWNQSEAGAVVSLAGEDGSDVIQTFPKMYLINGGSNPNYIRYIVSDDAFSYDGDVAKEVTAFGETPDYETLLNGISRCIANDTVAGSQGAGLGTNYSDTSFGNTAGMGRPKTQTSRYVYESSARQKNTNKNTNLPYCNATHQDAEVILALLYIECRTRILVNVFGHGISSNVAPTEATWGTVSGVRITKQDQTKLYYTLGGTIFVNGTSSNLWNAINNSFPLLKCLEAQKAVSDGATLEPVYDADGNKLAGIAEGVMTGIWTKTFSFSLAGFATTAAGETETVTVDVVLRVPMWRGKTNFMGNVWSWRSGVEVLNYMASGVTHNVLFRAPSIEAIVTDTDEAVKAAKGQFAFETAYDEVCDLGANSGWMKDDAVDGDWNSIVGINVGAAINNYISAYTYIAAGVEGQYARRGVRVGGSASGAYVVPRLCAASFAPSYAGAGVGSGFRVALA